MRKFLFNGIRQIFLLIFLSAVNFSIFGSTYIDGIYYDLNEEELTASVKGIPYVDYEYDSEVVIPSEVTYNGKVYSVTSIDDLAFYMCWSLTSIEIPNSVTYIGSSAFYNCDGLTSIELPNSLISIGYRTFEACLGLTSIKIPNSVTTIEAWAFNACKRLTSLQLPNSVTSIGEGAFSGCERLTSLQIPNSVTSIGDWAFEACSGLKSIQLPNSVNFIGRGAFSGCEGLKDVYYEATAPINCAKNIFDNSTYSSATLWVPQEAVELCLSINPWRNFYDIKPYVFSTGVEDIVFSPEEGYENDVKELTEVFTLDGVKVSETQENLAPGVYVIRKGSETKKIVVK